MYLIGVGQGEGHKGVSGFMIGGQSLLFLANDAASALWSGDDSINRLSEF